MSDADSHISTPHTSVESLIEAINGPSQEKAAEPKASKTAVIVHALAPLLMAIAMLAAAILMFSYTFSAGYALLAEQYTGEDFRSWDFIRAGFGSVMVLFSAGWAVRLSSGRRS